MGSAPRPVRALLPLLLLFSLACAGERPPVDRRLLSWQALAPPGAVRAEVPVWVASDGPPALLWVEGGEGSRRLMWSVLEESSPARWSAPATVATGADWLVHRIDTPAGGLSGEGTAVATWLVLDPQGGYGVRLARSSDGGFTWGSPELLLEPAPGREQGFVSLVPAVQGRLDAVWLDGRGEGGTALMGRRLDADRDSAARVLDERVCDCCPTAALRLADGSLLVAYRDRDADEVRDIAWLRVGANGEVVEGPRPVARDGWRIEGCPVNGPALARGDDGRLAAAWFSAGEDGPRVQVAFSAGDAIDFGAPERVDEGAPLGRVELVAFPGRGWLVLWLEEVADQGPRWCVRLREGSAGGSGRGGSPWGEVGLLAGVAEDIGQLRLASDAQGALAAWAAADGLHVARLGPPRE